MDRVLFSSASVDWATPKGVYDALHAEFDFTLDPHTLGDIDHIGLLRSWKGERVFCNPPYGPELAKWIAKAWEADVAVFLVPSRTDTRWWHEYAMKASEIRFVKGRLKFGDAKSGAPFPSALVIFRGNATARGEGPAPTSVL